MASLSKLVEPLAAVDDAVGRAAAALSSAQRADGHWVFELEADCDDSRRICAAAPLSRASRSITGSKPRSARYLRRIQSAEHGGWGLFHAGAFDVSASVKAYYALKMIGDDPDERRTWRAPARRSMARAGRPQSTSSLGSSWPSSAPARGTRCRPCRPS